MSHCVQGVNNYHPPSQKNKFYIRFMLFNATFSNIYFSYIVYIVAVNFKANEKKRKKPKTKKNSAQNILSDIKL
jgi:hypothetical protein